MKKIHSVSVAEAIGRLSRYAEIKKDRRLEQEEVNDVKHCMSVLRDQGWTIGDVYRLTKRVWSKVTIKAYWRGPSSGQEDGIDSNAISGPAASGKGGVNERPRTKSPRVTMQSLPRLLDSGQITEDGLRFIELFGPRLSENNCSIDDLYFILTQLQASGLPTPYIVERFKMAAASDMSPEEWMLCCERIAYLDKKNIGGNEIAEVIEAAIKFGEPSKIMKALNELGSLRAISARKRAVQAELDGLEPKASQTRLEIEKAQPLLAQYKRLKAMGFTEEKLGRLVAEAQKFGGFDNTLDAISEKASVKEIKRERMQEQAKLDSVVADRKKFEEVHARDEAKLAVCGRLVTEFKFKDATFARLSKVMDKVDNNPDSLIDTFETCGSLYRLKQVLEIRWKEYSDQSKQLDQLQHEKSSLEAKNQDLEVRNEQSRADLEQMITAQAKYLGTAIDVAVALNYDDVGLLSNIQILRIFQVAREIIQLKKLDTPYPDLQTQLFKIEYRVMSRYPQIENYPTLQKLKEKIQANVNKPSETSIEYLTSVLVAISNYPEEYWKRRLLEEELERIRSERDELRLRVPNMPATEKEWTEFVYAELENVKNPGTKEQSPILSNRLGIRKKVHETVNSMLKARMDEEFNITIKEQFKLATLKRKDFWAANWPTEFGEKTNEKIIMLEQLAEARPFQALCGEWKKTCSICGQVNEIRLEKQQIVNLLKGESFIWRIHNMACRSGGQVIKLEWVIDQYIMREGSKAEKKYFG